MADRSVGVASLVLAVSLLCGCQSTQHSSAELAQICADPNKEIWYYDECQAIHPSSAHSLARRYFREAPVGY